MYRSDNMQDERVELLREAAEIERAIAILDARIAEIKTELT